VGLRPPHEAKERAARTRLIKTGEVIALGQIVLVVNGIHILENLKPDELPAKKIHEFAFMMQPLKIQGGTGSTVAPIAVR
jgi:kynurenine formamidase